jgi:hypothetical protein
MGPTPPARLPLLVIESHRLGFVLVMLLICVLMGLQESLLRSGGNARSVLDDAGSLDALVATLKHDSPYCVAAAVGCLNLTARIPGGVKALLKANAIPALVGVVETRRPPANLEKETGLFRRCGLKRYILTMCASTNRLPRLTLCEPSQPNIP